MYFVLSKTDLRHGLSDTVFLWAPLPQAVLALYHAIAASAFTKSCQNYWKICSTLVVNIVLKPSADNSKYTTQRALQLQYPFVHDDKIQVESDVCKNTYLEKQDLNEKCVFLPQIAEFLLILADFQFC